MLNIILRIILLEFGLRDQKYTRFNSIVKLSPVTITANNSPASALYTNLGVLLLHQSWSTTKDLLTKFENNNNNNNREGNNKESMEGLDMSSLKRNNYVATKVIWKFGTP